jgi:hypothetical protein
MFLSIQKNPMFRMTQSFHLALMFRMNPMTQSFHLNPMFPTNRQ